MYFFWQATAFTCIASYLCFFVEHLVAMTQLLPASFRTTAPPIARVCIFEGGNNPIQGWNALKPTILSYSKSWRL